MIWLIIYVVGYVACAVLLSTVEAREKGVFTLADLGEALGWSFLWPLMIIVMIPTWFPSLNKEPSDIVLWRRKGGDK